jgi:methyl halide transferase
MNHNWQQRWDENKTGWDLGGPHPLLGPLLHGMPTGWNPAGKKVWVPGCGRAHDGKAFADLGAMVVAADVVPKAITEAKASYDGTRGLEMRVMDCLEPDVDIIGAVDLVFDRAMMCALNGEERRRYVAASRRVLRTGGIFASIVFSKVQSPLSGPPFEMSDLDIREALTRHFENIIISDSYHLRSPSSILEEKLIWAT